MLHRFFGRTQSSPVNAPTKDPRRMNARPLTASVKRGLPTQVVNPTELPSWLRNRTAVGGDLPMNNNDRRLVAVLDCGADGHLVLFTPGATTGRVLAGVESLLMAQGVHFIRCSTTHEILEIVYDNVSATAAAVPESGKELGEDIMARLFEELLRKAVELTASDIHIEVGPMRTCILMRVHGDMQVVRHLSLLKGRALSRHIFVNANSSGVDFNPDQFQDAKISKTLTIEGERVDLEIRFADMPTYPIGHDVTLRVLRSGGGSAKSLDSLGYNDDQELAIDRMLNTSTGLIVMCGSTGSGKSTTLAALIQAIADRHGGRKKIRTIEDPPEFILPGRQTPVVRGADGKSTGFSAALRAAMRGDPDIIMIGEVRDDETGELAMDATMTGHKVLTTVHGGSPFDAVDRLIKKQFDRSVLFAEGTLNGIIYQCLLPVLCPDCSVPMAKAGTGVSTGLRDRLKRSFSGDLDDLRFRGPGCDSCKLEAIVGRTVAASFLIPDRNLRQLLLNGDRFAAEEYWRNNEWKGVYAANGKTVLDQALAKMAQGWISPVDIEAKLSPVDSQDLDQVESTWPMPIARVVG